MLWSTVHMPMLLITVPLLYHKFRYSSEHCVLWLSNNHILLFSFRTLRSMDVKQSNSFVFVQNFAFYGCQTIPFFSYSSERSVLWMSNSHIFLFPFRTLRSMDVKQSHFFIHSSERSVLWMSNCRHALFCTDIP